MSKNAALQIVSAKLFQVTYLVQAVLVFTHFMYSRCVICLPVLLQLSNYNEFGGNLVLLVCTKIILRISVRKESQNRNLSNLTLLGKAYLTRDGVG
jgi:hypothetical protein